MDKLSLENIEMLVMIKYNHHGEEWSVRDINNGQNKMQGTSKWQTVREIHIFTSKSWYQQLPIEGVIMKLGIKLRYEVL